MDDSKIEEILERIAVALEAIAMALTSGNPQRNKEGLLNCSKDNQDAAGNESSHDVIKRYLSSRGISIKVIPPEDPADSIIDSLSLFLGSRYGALRNILSKIKRNMQIGGSLTESIADYSQEDISSICQFCTRLYEIAFLEQYKYSKSPHYIIKAKTTTLPKAQKFFGGQWLERYVLQKVKECHQMVQSEAGEAVSFSYLINPQIVLPNGDDFEMDLLAAFGEKLIYWIEAKSGDYQQHVAKYSKFSRILGLDSDHSFMVLTDVADNACSALSSLFGMSVVNLNTFQGRMLETLRKEILAPAAYP
jgi:hypothetical protein